MKSSQMNIGGIICDMCDVWCLIRPWGEIVISLYVFSEFDMWWYSRTRTKNICKIEWMSLFSEYGWRPWYNDTYVYLTVQSFIKLPPFILSCFRTSVLSLYWQYKSDWMEGWLFHLYLTALIISTFDIRNFCIRETIKYYYFTSDIEWFSIFCSFLWYGNFIGFRNLVHLIEYRRPYSLKYFNAHKWKEIQLCNGIIQFLAPSL